MHELIGQILGYLDVDSAVPHTVIPILRIPRYVLQHGYADQPWHEHFVLFTDLDRRQQLVQATYFFTGEPPTEELRIEGAVVEPLHAKTIEYAFCGRVLLRRRVMWVPANRKATIRLDGQDMEILYRRPFFAATMATPGAIRWHLGERSGRARNEADAFLTPEPETDEGRKAQRLSARKRVQRRYHHAWVLMDRIHDAADSAEILFKYIRDKHPDINAWFVLEEGTSDWKRLRSEGYGKRLVAHGSMEWRLLMSHALHLISSHADDAITKPPAITEFIRPPWKYHFLNHGVIKDDLSGWLNRKPIETFVTSTQQEFASIAGDSTTCSPPARCSSPACRGSTGCTRSASASGPTQRDLLLRRAHLAQRAGAASPSGTQRRDLDARLARVGVHAELAGLPRDDELCVRRPSGTGCTDRVPAPPQPPARARRARPPGVRRAASYDGADVQEYFARARLFVTDYSSMAFNPAYLERPVVYFQFDEDKVLDGGHVGRAGYFNYRRDGFGPVTLTAADAVAAAVAALEHGSEPMEPYRSRIEATFPCATASAASASCRPYAGRCATGPGPARADAAPPACRPHP